MLSELFEQLPEVGDLDKPKLVFFFDEAHLLFNDAPKALLDLKDLRAMLQHVGDNASQFTTEYGNVSAASIGAIQRGVLQIDSQGGEIGRAHV